MVIVIKKLESIKISAETKKDMKAKKHAGQSYDGFIRELMDKAGKPKK